MPAGSKGQRRPADVEANAFMVAEIATGEIDEGPIDDGKDLAAKSLVRKSKDRGRMPH
jgi:hypothetical protein